MRIILLVFVFLSGCAATDAAVPDGPAILDATRAAYQKLTGYHFAHDLEIDEAGADGKPVKTRLSFVTATDGAEYDPEDKIGPPLNLDRCRLEMRDGGGSMVVACADGECLLYDSRRKEFSRGKSFTDHFSSVGGSIFLGFATFVYVPLSEGALTDAKLVGEADVEVGNQTRQCYVVEGTMPARPPVDPDKPPEDPLLNLDWLLSMLALHDRGADKAPAQYSPRPLLEEPAKPADPTRVTLWIDRTTNLVCRSRLSAPYFKYTFEPDPNKPFEPKAGEEQGRPVQVTATFTFIVAEPTAPPKEFFRFTPLAGAKEVPNIRERPREKQ